MSSSRRPIRTNRPSYGFLIIELPISDVSKFETKEVFLCHPLMVDYTSENHALLSDPRLEHWLLRYPQSRRGGILLRDTPEFACPSPKYRSHSGQGCMRKKFPSDARMDGLVDRRWSIANP